MKRLTNCLVNLRSKYAPFCAKWKKHYFQEKSQPVDVKTFTFRTNSENFWLVRLMIDAEYQGKGYGKSATQAMIEKLNKEFECQGGYLSFVPENLKAEKLYSSLDFKRTGETDESGEVIMRFKSTDNRQPTTDN